MADASRVGNILEVDVGNEDDTGRCEKSREKETEKREQQPVKKPVKNSKKRTSKLLDKSK